MTKRKLTESEKLAEKNAAFNRARCTVKGVGSPSSKELTKAYTRYALKHGFFVRTVRAVSSLRKAAIEEWNEWQLKQSKQKGNV